MIQYKRDEYMLQLRQADPRLWDILAIFEQIHATFGPPVVVTCVHRDDGSVHSTGRAVDIRSRHLALAPDRKESIALAVSRLGQAMFGGWERPYCIWEHPGHANLALRNPEHWHLQVPPPAEAGREEGVA
jgi:hypothetical protein